MNIYQYFYRPCYDTTANFTGLFGLMGENDENILSGTILADNEFQAEARARIKEFEKLKRHFNFITGVEITKVIYLGRRAIMNEQ